MGEAVHGSGTPGGNYPNGSLVPTGLAEDSLHQHYATSSTAGTVTIYTAAFNTVVTSFTLYGMAIAIDPVHKLIYTAVPSNSTVFVYSLVAPCNFWAVSELGAGGAGVRR